MECEVSYASTLVDHWQGGNEFLRVNQYADDRACAVTMWRLVTDLVRSGAITMSSGTQWL